jgi:DNA-binding transcriptional MerR regulator
LDERVFERLEHPVGYMLSFDPAAPCKIVPKRRLLVIASAYDTHHTLPLLAFEKWQMHYATSSRLEVKELPELDIVQVAQRSGVPASTLRFYDQKGLITPIGRRGLRRVFDPNVLERLALIALGRTAGFSLEEIARMFAPDGQPRIDRQMLVAKAQELGKLIRELSAMREGLLHAAACRAPSHMECPTFRRILQASARIKRGKQRRSSR